MRFRLFVVSIFIISFCSLSSATIINIPADYPTIQQGIDASSDGDTVLVQPGTYVENINFNGHNIVLASLFLTTGNPNYIEQTVIDGNSSGTVICFENGEDNTAAITGLTIQNGRATYGGGIFCDNSYPVISKNIIVGNRATLSGGGIYLLNSNSTLIGNTIGDNATLWGGRAIFCYESSPIVVNSIIWGSGPSQVDLYGNSAPQISYCDINGILEGVGNIHLNPLFVNRENDNYNVCAGSPCIDSGDPDLLDPDGTRSDMGVFYPEHPQCQAGNRWYVSTAGNDTTGDGSEQNPFGTIQHGIEISVSGDSIIVIEGTYIENINYNGHDIVLGSLFLTTGETSYISTTIIDGNDNTVVIFAYGENENAVITGFTIQNGGGFGIYCYNSFATISHNIIENNYGSATLPGVDAVGGGISCVYSDPIIMLNRIIHNGAIGDYGAWACGIECINSNPTIVDNVVAHIFGIYVGAVFGIYLQDCVNPSIVNNVIVYNDGSYGGGIFGYQSNYSSVNNIIRDNSPWNIAGSPSTVMYCNVQEGWPGVGNIDLEPLFRDPEGGDFHLMSIACGDSADSPCIDAGDPNILDSLLDCSWGLGGLRSDMGAYGGGDSLITAILENMPPLPNQIILLQNYPNPFNAQTTVRFILPESQNVELTIYDILGRQVQVLLDEYRQAGVHTVTFEATDLSSGVYFYRLQSGDKVESKRMVFLK